MPERGREQRGDAFEREDGLVIFVRAVDVDAGRLERGAGDGCEEPATALEHALELGDRPGGLVDVFDGFERHDGVDRGVVKRQSDDIAAEERGAIAGMVLVGVGDGVVGDVDAEVRGHTPGVQQRFGAVAHAAGRVEHDAAGERGGPEIAVQVLRTEQGRDVAGVNSFHRPPPS